MGGADTSFLFSIIYSTVLKLAVSPKGRSLQTWTAANTFFLLLVVSSWIVCPVCILSLAFNGILSSVSAQGEQLFGNFPFFFFFFSIILYRSTFFHEFVPFCCMVIYIHVDKHPHVAPGFCSSLHSREILERGYNMLELRAYSLRRYIMSLE